MKSILRWFFRRKSQFQSATPRWKILLRRCIRRRLLQFFILLFFGLALFSVFSVRENSFNDLFLAKPLPVIVEPDPALVSPSDRSCSHFSCFDLYRCNALDDYRISVFVHPETIFAFKESGLRLEESETFHLLKDAIRRNGYYTGDPETACVFLQPVDLLFPKSKDLFSLSSALASTQL